MLLTLLGCIAIAAALAPGLHRRLGGRAAWLLAAIPAAIFAWLIMQAGAILQGNALEFVYDWVPSLGVEFAMRLDGLSLLFALLISGIGSLIILYSRGYFATKPSLGRFQAYIFLFMGSMLGLVLADDLITLFVFWELTSVTSYLLIGFDHESERARAGARKALLITGGGGLALLFGIVILSQQMGTGRISELIARPAASGMWAAWLLITVGALAKSAQFPFHIWLPDAMEAPTPASTFLHSATMVKAGIYLLARLHPLLAQHEGVLLLLTIVGWLTFVMGAWLTLQQTDLKALLAYSTISSLGLMVAFLGHGSALALKAALLMLLAHALYKACLFLVVGVVDHEFGTRDWTKLGGLARAIPATTATAIVAALAMAGVPPSFGFIAKETVLEAVLGLGPFTFVQAVWLLAAVLGTGLTVTYSLLLIVKVFFGRRRSQSGSGHDPWLMTGPALVLALLTALLAWPPLRSSTAGLLTAAVSAVRAERVQIDLYLWHGVTPALGLSLSLLTLGVIGYLFHERLWRLQRRMPQSLRADWYYEGGLSLVDTAAKFMTNRLQTGQLRHYLLVIFSALFALTLGGLISRPGLTLSLPPLEAVRPFELALAGLLALSVVTVVVIPSRLGSIAALGATGYLVSGFYIVYSAPDLALTQLLIESLSVMLLVLVFYLLPRFFEDRSSRRSRLRDLTIAAGVGTLIALLTVLTIPMQPETAASAFFLDASAPLAFGENVVNVILVDFRSLDTLGEITVLAIAALGSLALLRLRMDANEVSGS